jgi:16S rRNA (guanine966-N2)-methyltransferase
MRVTSGEYKNRKLIASEDNAIRPTSDRMRQTIFNLLSHAKWRGDFEIENARCLDLFCGSGALGLEALSRGATHCVFVDRDIKAVQKNIEALKLKSDCFLVKKSDATTLSNPFDSPYDLVFLDPPYFQNLIEPTLQNLIDKKMISKNTIIIVEAEKSFKNSKLFRILDSRHQSKSSLYVLRYDTTINQGKQSKSE